LYFLTILNCFEFRISSFEFAIYTWRPFDLVQDIFCAFARVTPTWFWLCRAKNTWVIAGQATSGQALSQKGNRVKANLGSVKLRFITNKDLQASGFLLLPLFRALSACG